MEKYVYRAKLDRVVDGDTVDAMIDVGFDIWIKRRIRFKGMNAWESRTRNLEEKKLGLAAKDRLIELLTEVSSKPGFFRIKSYGEGKYGRVLAELFIMDKDDNVININETLITEGHAHEYDGGKRKEFK
jgi:micrococcal nuclease